MELFKFWKKSLKAGGFKLEARILNFPDGKSGDVGLFLSWPKSRIREAPSGTAS